MKFLKLILSKFRRRRLAELSEYERLIVLSVRRAK